jgi:glyoxylase I family protein
MAVPDHPIVLPEGRSMTLPLRGLTTLLQVFDMPRSLAFYRDLLGFEIVCTSPGENFSWAMLRQGDCTLMLNTAYDEGERPAAPDPARVAAHGDTILYFVCDNADDVHAHLRAKGWETDDPVTTYYGMRQAYTKDPDGYAVCFQHPVAEETKPAAHHEAAPHPAAMATNHNDNEEMR